MSINVNQLPSLLNEQYDEWKVKGVNYSFEISTSAKSYSVRVLSSNQMITLGDQLAKDIFFRSNVLDPVSEITEASPEKVITVIVNLRRELKDEESYQKEKEFDIWARTFVDTVKIDMDTDYLFETPVRTVILDFCHQSRRYSFKEVYFFDHFILNGEKIR